MNSRNNQSSLWLAPTLLLVSGIILGAGNSLNLADFGSWRTLAIGGASLFAAGILWGNLDSTHFTLPALGLSVFGGIMCLTGLPAQMRVGEMLAAGANLVVIGSFLIAAYLIWQARSPMSAAL